MAIDWDNDHEARRRLRTALAKNDKKARVADLLCEDVGLDQARVEFSDVGELVWNSVLTEARNMQAIPALVRRALERWPKDETLRELASDGAPPAAAATAFTVSALAVPAALAEGTGDPRDPLEKNLSDLAIADAAQWGKDYAAMMGRVALVQTGVAGSGTGFLIGPDLLLTNWHVVKGVADGKVAAADVTVRFDYWRDADGAADQFVEVGLAAGWLLDHAPWSKVDVTAGSVELPLPDELDFAVVRLARAIGAELRGAAPRGWVSLPATTAVAPGQSVLILQHPQGHPLRLAFDGVLSVNGNNTRVRYRTNTLPGSSGSPCFDQNWTLLALHHAGDPRLAPVYNEGIPAAAIAGLLAQRGKVTLAPPP